ncbi:hypothetical protein BD779DRAFT_1469623 [Infundibulicybe gibba]|nr:hypothetical protein BD779DRAFT_1469623 [Infundibulicybe gibba]
MYIQRPAMLSFIALALLVYVETAGAYYGSTILISPYHSSSDRDLSSQDESNPADNRSYFDAADTNKDGKLSYAEWAASDAVKGQNLTPGDLVAHWAKYDGDGNGFLTEAEATSRKDFSVE